MSVPIPMMSGIGLRVENGYDQTIGSIDSSMHVDMTSAAANDVDFAGGAVSYLRVDNFANINVTRAAAASATGLHGLNLVGVTSAAAAINVQADINNDVGIGVLSDIGSTALTEIMEVDTIAISGGEVFASSSVISSNAASAVTVQIVNGTVRLENATSAVTQDAGTLTLAGSASVVSPKIWGGNCKLETTGTLGATTVIGPNGIVDASGDPRVKDVTLFHMHAGAALRDPGGTIGTAVVKTVNCDIDDVTLQLGNDSTYTKS